MKDTLTLKYSGAQVRAGRMDAYETAGNIIAFADFIGVAARATYGEGAKLKTEVKAFEHGSFAVQFALDFGLLQNLFASGPDPRSLYDLIWQSFEAWKHLKGEDPLKTEVTNDGSVHVTNHGGQVAIYRAETINIITSPEAAAAASRFVGKPMEGALDSVTIEHGREVIASSSRADAPYIGFLAARETLTENIVKVWLNLESPVFKEGNKWKFSDGQSSFYAEIEDKAFLADVDKGRERFGKGDLLFVEMRHRQSGTVNGFKLERSIIKVIEHKLPAQQSRLL